MALGFDEFEDEFLLIGEACAMVGLELRSSGFGDIGGFFRLAFALDSGDERAEGSDDSGDSLS